MAVRSGNKRNINGYVKIFRSMLDWEWYTDTNTKVVWLHILLRANWQLQKFQGEMVYAGELITTVRSLAEETGLSQREIRTALDHLKATHELTIKTTNKFTKITVEKWRFFQVDEGVIDKQNDNQTTQI